MPRAMSNMERVEKKDESICCGSLVGMAYRLVNFMDNSGVCFFWKYGIIN